MTITRKIFSLLSGLALLFSFAVTAAPESQTAQPAEHKTHAERHVKPADTTPVDLNTADAKTLLTLKGIGQKKADQIIAYRNEHGTFQSVDDLAKVKGFGQKRLERLLKQNPGRVVIK